MRYLYAKRNGDVVQKGNVVGKALVTVHVMPLMTTVLVMTETVRKSATRSASEAALNVNSKPRWFPRFTSRRRQLCVLQRSSTTVKAYAGSPMLS